MVLQALDIVGVFVFAISGALVAVRKDMDIFGMFVLAFLPAVGGGTLRDLILDVPVFWTTDVTYVGLTALAVSCVFFGHRFVSDATCWLTWMDAVGLSVFSVLGCQKALETGVGGVVAVMMGVITAVAGGVIRDVVANDVPYVLKQEIYATAALVGSAAYLLLVPLHSEWVVWVAIAAALSVRSAGIVWSLSLPKAKL
ncbi:MAG: trimeric intracellular cation channel family protein [Pseudomonadales bacterium]